MFVTVILVVLALVVLGGLAVAAFAHGYDADDIRVGGCVTSGVTGLILAVAVVLSCTAMVSTKNVGIVTAFNRPVGQMDNGLHLKWPWEDVTEMDAAIQTDSDTQAHNDCVSARIAHQIGKAGSPRKSAHSLIGPHGAFGIGPVPSSSSAPASKLPRCAWG